MQSKSIRLAVLSALFVGSTSAFASISGITSFGDSLSDMGNVSAGTFGLAPGANYWQGRWSNGNVWVERYATSQSWSISRSSAGGNNWAYGGAETGTGTFGFFFPNVRNQVASYLGTSPTISSNRLFSIWGGGNDYRNGATNPATPVSNIEASITSLYGAGARVFLIPNLPLLGYIPQYFGTPNQAGATALSIAHNSLLKSRISALRSSLAGVTIYEMDVATRFEDVRMNPALYGLTNVTQSALVGNTLVPNPDSYLFYDEIHPTRKGHEILKNLAIQSVPEPATMATVTLATLILARRRRLKAN